MGRQRRFGELFGFALPVPVEGQGVHRPGVLPLLKSEETVGIAYGIIGLGKKGTEPALKDALMRFGDEGMAREYRKCGNPTLETAAQEWAAANGYSVSRLFGTAEEESWGSLK